MKSNSTLPLRTALLWILLSTLLISGSASIGVVYYRHVKNQRLKQPQYNIVAIVQTTPDKERLKTIFLAELLNLSVDQPTNLFRFNSKEAQKKLLSSSLITSARVKKILPGTVYVDYTLRKPVATLLDYSNTVIDHEAVAFPFKPFFTPKILPEIYLGMNDPVSHIWGRTIQGIKCRLALYLLDLITENFDIKNSSLIRIDVSKALADSEGQKQIVVIIEDHVKMTSKSGATIKVIVPQILRLSVDHYRQELANFLAIHSVLQERNFNLPAESYEKDVRVEPFWIDLRLPELAYIKNGG